MPDHLHLLVEAQAETSHGLVYIKRAKQLSAYHFKRRFAARLWQRYGYEHVLRGDQDTLSVARYIIENPVRAGLVKRVEDYPFIGSTVYSISEILEAVQLKPPSRKSRD
jgi:REP element-mobilizing transposase RayT